MAPLSPLDMTGGLAPILWMIMAMTGYATAMIALLATRARQSTEVAEPRKRVERSQRPRQTIRIEKRHPAPRTPLGMGKPSAVPAPS